MTDSDTLLALFKASTRPLTYAKIAKKTGTYPATAKRRVEALLAAGVKLKKVKYREGRRGFESEAWVLNA